MANNSDPPTGRNTENILRDQRLTRRNDKNKETTEEKEEEEEVEVSGVKSAQEQRDETMKRDGIIDLCSPTKALDNNNDKTIIDTMSATDDEMKRLRSEIAAKDRKISTLNQVDSNNTKLKVIIGKKNTEISKLNTELSVIQKEKNEEMKRLRSEIVAKDRKISALNQVDSNNTRLKVIIGKKNSLSVIQKEKNEEMKRLRSEIVAKDRKISALNQVIIGEENTEISRLNTELKEKNKEIQNEKRNLERAEAQATKTTIEIKRRHTITVVAGIVVIAFLLLLTCGGMLWLLHYGEIHFSDGVTVVLHRSSCSE